MIYQFDSMVRYSEVDQEQQLSLCAAINYFQDCSTFHSESRGIGIARQREKNRAWVLSSWQIELLKRPVLGQKITIQTWPYDFKGFYGFRNFSINDEEGERMIIANSVWVYLDTATGHPARVDQEEQEGYPLGEKLPMDYAARKIPLPKNTVLKEPVAVLRHQLDTNGHMNNGQYILLAQDYLPEGFTPIRMRAEYKKQALEGDIMIPQIACEEGTITVALCDDGQKPYAIVEFIN
ncbi:MAG: thioesterase [Eubacteriales bacterium]|nr:thioesterase [Eubacteriales bacterium]